MIEITLHLASISNPTTPVDAIVVGDATPDIPVGEATIFDGSPRIIHAPVMKHPDEPIPAKQVELACVAALRVADEANFIRIAMPALGTGAGQVEIDDCARIMMETIGMYMVDNQLAKVDLYTEDPDIFAAWQKHSIT